MTSLNMISSLYNQFWN
uniref:Uncharacterized protein n=1 Tax=Lepeophtheirus salmonis TaxID=72036 RepID=A0A0K2UZP9_LEPSM